MLKLEERHKRGKSMAKIFLEEGTKYLCRELTACAQDSRFLCVVPRPKDNMTKDYMLNKYSEPSRGDRRYLPRFLIKEFCPL